MDWTNAHRSLVLVLRLTFLSMHIGFSLSSKSACSLRRSCQHFQLRLFFADDGAMVFELGDLLKLLSTQSDLSLDGVTAVGHEFHFLGANLHAIFRRCFIQAFTRFTSFFSLSVTPSMPSSRFVMLQPLMPIVSWWPLRVSVIIHTRIMLKNVGERRKLRPLQMC